MLFRSGRRVVEAHERGIPVFAAVGARKVRDGTVSLRRRDGATSVLPLPEAVATLRGEARL